MKHKRQHYIPSSYLQAWCDPKTPKGQTPYVWLFSKDGSEVIKKPPQKIFHEKDLYTIHSKDGERDLVLEYNLSRLESEFSKLRKNKLNKHLLLTWEERLILCMFVAAMFGRTKSYGEHWSSQWKEVLDLGERMQEWANKASPEERERMSSILSKPHTDEKNTLTLEDVRELVERPIPSSLTGIVKSVSPLLFEIPFLILEIPDRFGFITSDAPCVWFDPALYQQPKPFGAGGLISPTIEITLPLSPQQMLFFGKGLALEGIYIPVVEQHIIDNLNKRTRLWAHEYFVFNQSVAKPSWF